MARTANRDCIPPTSFDLIQSEVGIVQQVLDGRSRMIEAADADTEGHGNLDRGGQILTDPFGNLCGSGDVRIRKEEGEFVATESTGEIEGSTVPAKDGPGAGQHMVTDDRRRRSPP
jgi:hypothetical protein